LLNDLSKDEFPSRFLRWDSAIDLPSDGTYLSIPGAAEIKGGSGIVTTRIDFEGFFVLSGPVEEIGHLRYIDDCTDSLLIPPVILDDPCLNLLHIPPHTEQTRHTHPSFRTGLIISGSGECVTPDATKRSSLDSNVRLGTNSSNAGCLWNLSRV